MACDCEHGDKVKELSQTVYGNGRPEKSLLVRVDNIDKHVLATDARLARIEKIGYTIIAAVALTLLTQFTDMIRVVPPNAVTPASVGVSP